MPRGAQMTPQQIGAMFPNASRSLIEANSGFTSQPEIVPVMVAAKLRRGKQPNKTESEFGRILEHRKLTSGDPEFISVRFEAAKLRIAENCYYTPDWMCEDHKGRITFFEVKGGHIWDDSKVKFKAAAELHTWANFEMHQKKGGAWTRIL
jgi:hypothetical protein